MSILSRRPHRSTARSITAALMSSAADGARRLPVSRFQVATARLSVGFDFAPALVAFVDLAGGARGACALSLFSILSLLSSVVVAPTFSGSHSDVSGNSSDVSLPNAEVVPTLTTPRTSGWFRSSGADAGG